MSQNPCWSRLFTSHLRADFEDPGDVGVDRHQPAVIENPVPGSRKRPRPMLLPSVLNRHSAFCDTTPQ